MHHIPTAGKTVVKKCKRNEVKNALNSRIKKLRWRCYPGAEPGRGSNSILSRDSRA